jgi:hypothetical protein
MGALVTVLYAVQDRVSVHYEQDHGIGAPISVLCHSALQCMVAALHLLPMTAHGLRQQQQLSSNK